MSVLAPAAGTTVGRETELDQLEAALDALGGRRLGAASPSRASPGSARRACSPSCARAPRTAATWCSPARPRSSSATLPFSVWADALDAYVASQELELDDGWDAELLDELAGILPSPARRRRHRRAGARRRALPRAPRRAQRCSSCSPRTERARARARRPALERHARRSSCSRRCCGAGPTAPVLLALALPARPGARAARRARWPCRPRGGSRCDQLSEAEAARAARRRSTHAAARDVYRHGGGNPFYLEQLARATRGRPLGRPALERATARPACRAAVAASLAEELGSLAPPSAALLEAAAVAGEPFEPDLAAAIAELTAGRGPRPRSTSCSPSTSSARPRCRAASSFRHPLVRRAVYESARGGWRLAAHARAADALAARGAAAAERAHHVEQSAAPGRRGRDRAAARGRRGDAAARAPAAAARWFEAALRLLPARRPRRARSTSAWRSPRRSARSASSSAAATTLLEALELLPPDVDRRARRADRALRRGRALAGPPRGGPPAPHARVGGAARPRRRAAAAALQIELAVDGLYELDFEQTLAMGRGALETARALGDRPLIAAAAAALCLGEVGGGRDRGRARAPRGGARAGRRGCPTPSWRRGWRRSTTSAGPRTTSSTTTTAIAHADRGIAIARATGEGRLLVPLMLVKGYPFEMQGRLAEAHRAVRGGRRGGAPLGEPALPVLGAVRARRSRTTTPATSTRAIAAGEESARVGGRLAGGDHARRRRRARAGRSPCALLRGRRRASARAR